VKQLRRAEVLLGEGRTVADVCKRLRVTEVTTAGRRTGDARPRQALEGAGEGEQPAQARGGGAGPVDIRVLKDIARGNSKPPSEAAVAMIQRRHGLSERRACQMVGLARSAERYRPQQRSDERRLRRAATLLRSLLPHERPAVHPGTSLAAELDAEARSRLETGRGGADPLKRSSRAGPAPRRPALGTSVGSTRPWRRHPVESSQVRGARPRGVRRADARAAAHVASRRKSGPRKPRRAEPPGAEARRSLRGLSELSSM
jgi:hypothetical protein